MTRRKTCTCCGEFAGRWEQWHNQDLGYGLCRRCVLMIRAKMERSEFERSYGQPGVHYLEPGTAKEMADMQRRYDRLHHERRAFDLGARETELTHFERDLLRSSRYLISQPVWVEGFHSVDINDTEALAELDAWDQARKQPPCCDNCGNSKDDTERQGAYLGVTDPICCEVNQGETK